MNMIQNWIVSMPKHLRETVSEACGRETSLHKLYQNSLNELGYYRVTGREPTSVYGLMQSQPSLGHGRTDMLNDTFPASTPVNTLKRTAAPRTASFVGIWTLIHRIVSITEYLVSHCRFLR